MGILNNARKSTTTAGMIGGALNLPGKLGRKMAPTLQTDYIIAAYKAGGLWALPSAVVWILQAIAFFTVAASSFYAPAFALVLLAPWGKWHAARYGVKLTFGGGFEAWKRSIWLLRRPLFWTLCAVYVGSIIFSLLVAALTSNPIGGNSAVPSVITFIGGGIYFFIWRWMVKTSINEAIAQNTNDPTEEEIFMSSLMSTLGITKLDVLNKKNVSRVGMNIRVSPVPQQAINAGMEEKIRKNAIVFFPNHELVSADAGAIVFGPVTDAERERRNHISASDGAITGRRVGGLGSGYFQESDFE